MVTVLRADGLRVIIYVNDHPPAHVHVFGDGEAKINLIGTQGAPDLVWGRQHDTQRGSSLYTGRSRTAVVSAAEMGGDPWPS
jgi:hypothetical protein